jgi:hypothetical protein
VSSTSYKCFILFLSVSIRKFLKIVKCIKTDLNIYVIIRLKFPELQNGRELSLPKTARKPPKGWYTGQQAAKRLKLPLATFYHRVKSNKIKAGRYIPPGYAEGYFSKEDIDNLAQERELAAILHSVEPIIFSRASSEDDIRGIVDLCIAIYGQNGTPNYDARLEIWQKNPEVYYCVLQEGIVVGYISIIWFDDEALNTLMGPTPQESRITTAGSGVYSITGTEHVRKFTEGEPIDSLFVSLGVRPGMSPQDQRDYAIKLLRGTQEVLVSFVKRGMPIHKLLATSERGDGIVMARKLGMKETRYPNDHILRYELNMETADNQLLQPYKQALAEWRAQH